jgi:hypothetical protein
LTLSLAALAYLMRVRPFRSVPAIQSLEEFNELMVLLGCYHLVVFSDLGSGIGSSESGEALDLEGLKYTYGWSLDMLITAKLTVNVLVIGKMQVKEARRQIRAFCEDRREARVNKGVRAESETIKTGEEQTKIESSMSKLVDSKVEDSSVLGEFEGEDDEAKNKRPPDWAQTRFREVFEMLRHDHSLEEDNQPVAEINSVLNVTAVQLEEPLPEKESFSLFEKNYDQPQGTFFEVS